MFYHGLETELPHEPTRKNYRAQLKRFFRFLSETGKINRASTLTKHDISEYRKFLFDEGYSVYTVSGYIIAVRKFYELLEANKIYPNIAKSIKPPKRGENFVKNKDPLSVEQIRKILKMLKRNTLSEKRAYALFVLMVYTGIRRIEVHRTVIEDIRMEQGEHVLYVQGKGRLEKDAFVLLMPPVIEAIDDYLNARRKDQKEKDFSNKAALFTSISKNSYGKGLKPFKIGDIIRKIFNEAGINSKRVTPHSLRHTAITLAIKGGAKLVQAQAMARHIDPKTTLAYFKNLDRIEHGAEKFIKIQDDD